MENIKIKSQQNICVEDFVEITKISLKDVVIIDKIFLENVSILFKLGYYLNNQFDIVKNDIELLDLIDNRFTNGQDSITVIYNIILKEI